ncbi:type II secretion system F family protein [Ornithinimicrobium sufpigmenti]|uniref:type II secretion system F family protein n=1 Tax=Ornithinimicrobium sufpigmenti TaxID=2508882 RepID=UPI00192E01DF|nr:MULTISPECIES: type II secretion system F family protein [unclassified Ornithinimicrobium]
MDGRTLMLLGAALVGVALLFLVFAFSSGPDATRRRALENLARESRAGATEDPYAAPSGWLYRTAYALTPMGMVKRIDRLLGGAGRPARWPLHRVLVTKLVTTAVTAGVFVLLLSGGPTPRMVLFAVGTTTAVWLLPELLLYNTAQKRQQAIQEALPDTLDQLTISVEAGLGFEAAITHVARGSEGPLADEFVRTLQEIQVGVPRRVAYRGLTSRVQVEDLRRFVRAIMQGEEHGISIARVLSTQAAEMRVKRRQRAEEKAMQIPVKVVFPLILFILPALFIVVMGPGVINILQAFSGL